jgi:hypothetical protein
MPRTPARDDRANGEGEEHNAAQIRELILASGKYPTEDEVQDMIEQHKSGKPLAYITGVSRQLDLMFVRHSLLAQGHIALEAFPW